MSGLSRRELLIAAGALPLPCLAGVARLPLTLIADRATLPPSWGGRALIIESGIFLSEAALDACPAGPAAAALTPANAFLLADLLRVRRCPLIWRAGLQHFTLGRA